jgi:hypothetical protein
MDIEDEQRTSVTYARNLVRHLENTSARHHIIEAARNLLNMIEGEYAHLLQKEHFTQYRFGEVNPPHFDGSFTPVQRKEDIFGPRIPFPKPNPDSGFAPARPQGIDIVEGPNNPHKFEFYEMDGKSITKL